MTRPVPCLYTAFKMTRFDSAIAESRARLVFPHESRVPFGRIRTACAIALHMHQPRIPAGGNDLHAAALISNLQYIDGRFCTDNLWWLRARGGDIVLGPMQAASSKIHDLALARRVPADTRDDHGVFRLLSPQARGGSRWGRACAPAAGLKCSVARSTY
jgi:hypothetical protein